MARLLRRLARFLRFRLCLLLSLPAAWYRGRGRQRDHLHLAHDELLLDFLERPEVRQHGQRHKVRHNGNYDDPHQERIALFTSPHFPSPLTSVGGDGEAGDACFTGRIHSRHNKAMLNMLIGVQDNQVFIRDVERL